MKKVIKPAEREEAVYYSDFSGKSFGAFSPPVELSISFNYGSKYDGAGIQLDIDDDELEPVLEIIKKSISEDCKNKIRKNLEQSEKRYEDSMQMRDWEHCDILSNNLWFWRKLLDLKIDQ
jgi:hypothetical protein